MALYHETGSETVLTNWDEAVPLLCGYVLPPQDTRKLIGKETEMHVVDRGTLLPIDHATYRQLLQNTAAVLGDLDPVFEGTGSNRILVGLTGQEGSRNEGSTVFDEPGCQVEWSGRPRDNLHDVADDENLFLEGLSTCAEELGLAITMQGLFPLVRGKDIPLSQRSRPMALQPRINRVKSGRGHDLSRGTCSSQINLDTTRENWILTVQAGLGIQPFVTALFANAVFFDAKPSGNQNERAVVWNEWGTITEQTRALILCPDFSIETFVHFVSVQELPLLARPSERGGDIALPEGTTYRDLVDSKKIDPELRERIGAVTVGDFLNALNTLYAQIKIKDKGRVEFRAADSSKKLRHAAGAFLVGLIYDPENLKKVHALTSQWTLADHEKLAHLAPRQGLQAQFTSDSGENVSLRAVSQQLCRWAHEGLVRRGLGEDVYLQPLSQIAEGTSLTLSAQTLLDYNRGQSVFEILRRDATMPVAAFDRRSNLLRASL